MLKTIGKSSNKTQDLENTIQLQEHQIRSQQEQIRNLTSQLEWFKRQIFGQKSERLIDDPGNQPELELDIPAGDENDDTEKISVPEHTRNRDKKGKGEHTLVIPDGLPCEEVIHELPERERICPKTGKLMVEISREIVCKLARHSADYFIKKHIYIKYGVPGEALSGVTQAPAPPCIIEGSKFEPCFMADLVVEKFAYHMPINRIQERLLSFDIKATRQVLSSLLINIGDKLVPLYDLMIRKIFENGVIFTDDTPVKLLVKGAGKAQKGHMWIYLGGKPNAPPYHVYTFTEDWSHDHPIQFLKKFKGAFHADALEAYVKLDQDREDVSWAACWAHARRYFERALTGSKGDFCLNILRMIRWVFLYERVAWNRSPDERLAIRQKREKAIVEKIFKLLHTELSAPDLLPSSKTSTAIQYMLKHKKNFMLFLDNPDLKCHNNPAESGLRKVCIGKKNWMFVGSLRAGDSAAVLFSLVQTCRAMGINPKEYLEDLFVRFLDHPANRIEELLPDQWAANRQQSSRQ